MDLAPAALVKLNSDAVNGDISKLKNMKSVRLFPAFSVAKSRGDS
jgi:hypothetical protein